MVRDERTRGADGDKTRLVAIRAEQTLDEDRGDGTRVLRPLEVAAPDANDPTFAWLVAFDGKMRGKVFDLLRGQNLIGRGGQCHIVVTDDFVSEFHAAVREKDGRFVFWDLGSANGTTVNGEEVTAARALTDGDRITLGKQVFIFKQITP